MAKGSCPTVRARRKVPFTKTEIKNTSEAADEAGINNWVLEKTFPDGTSARFICGTGSIEQDTRSEWDKHESR